MGTASHAVAVPPEDGGSRDAGSIAWIHSRVREAILSGELLAGEPINQVHLAAQLGVSRTPIREVLRLLEREGLVQSEHNRRVRVAPFSMRDLEEIYAARVVNEALAVRLSVLQMTDADLDELRACLEAMKQFAHEQDYERWIEPHHRFHDILVMYAGDRLRRDLARLSDHAARYRRFYTTQAPRAWDVGISDHTAILEACERRSQSAAAAALATHLGRTAVSTIALIDPAYDGVALRAALMMVTSEVPQAAQDR